MKTGGLRDTYGFGCGIDFLVASLGMKAWKRKLERPDY